MNGRNVSRALRGSLVLSLLCATATACYKWYPIEPPIAATLAESHQTQVRLILADGDSVVLYHPGIRGDSIVGFPANSQLGWPDSFAAIGDVAGAEERRSDTGASVGLVVGGIVAVGLIAFMATAIVVMGDPDY